MERLRAACLHGCARAAILIVLLLVGPLMQTSVVRAQSEPSAGDRAAAGEAYDRGTAAFLAHEYARAAQLFETAYRLAPSAPALIQAIRAYEHSENELRAASLALRLEALYGSDRQALRQAHLTLSHASSQYLHVIVACDATCTVELDGTLEDAAFFVDPASAHVVRASFDTGAADAQSTSGAAGETQTLSFTRPPAPPPPPVDDVAVLEAPVEPVHQPPPPHDSSGIHPAVFITMAALTVAAGGVLIWSAVDMYGGVPAYQANPTAAALQDGQSRELRTDILWGVTGALAATSVVLAIFTDWGGSSASDTQTPTVSLLGVPGGGGLRLDGTF